MKRFFLTLTGSLMVLSLFAQKRPIIGDDSVILVGTYKVALTDARRIPTQPRLETPTIKPPQLEFDIRIKPEEVPSQVQMPKAERMDKPRPTFYKNNYIKAGYGNYNTSLVDAYITMPGKIGILGFDAHLLNTNPGQENLFREFNTGLWGKRHFKSGSLDAHFNYTSNEYRFYGYDQEGVNVPENRRQNFNTFEGGIGWGSKDLGRRKPFYDVDLNFYHLTQNALDSIKPVELGFAADAVYRMPIQKQTIDIALGYRLQDYNSVYDTFTRHLVNIQPNYRIEKKQWILNLGFAATIVAQNDDPVNFKFFPRVNGEYIIEKNSLSAFGGFGGSLNNHSVQEFSGMNPFISPQQDLSTSVTQFDLEAGLKGKLGKNTGFVIRMQFERHQDMPLFINDSLNLHWFINIRDDVQRISLNAEVNHHFSEKFRVAFSGFYHNYQTKLQQHAWQLPNLELKLLGTYNIGNKILLNADVFFIGQRYGYTAYGTDEQIVELKPFVDASIGIEYRWKKQISAFAKFYNLAHQQYAYWNRFQVNGFTAMGGLTIGF